MLIAPLPQRDVTLASIFDYLTMEFGALRTLRDKFKDCVIDRLNRLDERLEYLEYLVDNLHVECEDDDGGGGVAAIA
ncbi:hypothetical protein V6N13_061346 [Hibiscus sabdariffa]|uniref:Rx N-terminal domain-containing protein n=1 Tax=Hibiscus sabdariffa TaxID=183260 RepID=A0ABR2EFJ8_9ROSI